MDNTLKPIKLTIEPLRRADANARLANDFMLKKKRESNGNLSRELMTMNYRINNRKNQELEELLHSLINGTMRSKKILKFTIGLMKRLFDEELHIGCSRRN